jgi:HlyD family secretion protein
MHIPKDKPQRSKFLIMAGVPIAAIAFVLWLSISQLKQGSATNSAKFHTTTVSVGTFKHSLAAFGVLKTSNTRIIMSEVDGTVSHLHMKPGAIIEADSVVLALVNPDIVRELADAQFGLKEAHAEYSLQKSAIEEQALKLRNDEKMAQADLEIVQSELTAHASLAQRKIISQVDFKKVKLQLKKVTLRHQLMSDQLAHFIKSKPIKLTVAELQLAKAKRHLQTMQNDLNSLNVTAGMQGVLQSIFDDVQPGARITKGRKIGVVADTKSLYAELEINAADAALLVVGMPIVLNVKGQTVGAASPALPQMLLITECRSMQC